MARDEAGPVQQDQRLEVNGFHELKGSYGARGSVIAKLLQYAGSRRVAKPSHAFDERGC